MLQRSIVRSMVCQWEVPLKVAIQNDPVQKIRIKYMNSSRKRRQYSVQTWNVVRNCCTDRESECKHRTAANRTSPFGSPSPANTSSIRSSFSMIRFRIFSSLAPNEAKHRNAPCRDNGAEHFKSDANEFTRWLLIDASRCSSESICMKWRNNNVMHSKRSIDL